jgi:4-aminobutyrate aminotransferase
VLANVAARSSELLGALSALRADHYFGKHILDVRGAGLMVAVEFASPAPVGAARDPLRRAEAAPKLASRVAKRCVEKGMLLLTTSVYEVVRFIPPLNMSADELKQGCAIFEEALEEVLKEDVTWC